MSQRVSTYSRDPRGPVEILLLALPLQLSFSCPPLGKPPSLAISGSEPSSGAQQAAALLGFLTARRQAWQGVAHHPGSCLEAKAETQGGPLGLPVPHPRMSFTARSRLPPWADPYCLAARARKLAEDHGLSEGVCPTPTPGGCATFTCSYH